MYIPSVIPLPLETPPSVFVVVTFRPFGEYGPRLWLASSLMEGLAMILIMAAMKCGNKKAAREELTTQEKTIA